MDYIVHGVAELDTTERLSLIHSLNTKPEELGRHPLTRVRRGPWRHPQGGHLDLPLIHCEFILSAH